VKGFCAKFLKNMADSTLLHLLLSTASGAEILLPHTMDNSSLRAALERTSGFVTLVKRHHFNDNKGLEDVQTLATPETGAVELQLAAQYLVSEPPSPRMCVNWICVCSLQCCHGSPNVGRLLARFMLS
jgi:hypothetical protein